MDMPKVIECTVMDCAYNRNRKCHALAITVGDDRPRCDTYISGSSKGGDQSEIAGVGACKVTGCEYNSSLECNARGIRVGKKDDPADCLTYEPR